ncbi:hypothetical protein PR202_ga15389 [Eleusine coracana subsp. coracana]|uniref:Uncharacterized protein n=1 Tax=Eleusine coracana subsp. coracana TaxID=191504 RepID=A0AAV5CIU5_ELECO|nr:hypothetical protein PR202_ga15389 [Eleusine coracana subsp. coracana]
MRLLASAALLLLVALAAAGPAAAQDAAVEGAVPAAAEVAANARAQEAAVLEFELAQLRAKISTLVLGGCFTGFALKTELISNGSLRGPDLWILIVLMLQSPTLRKQTLKLKTKDDAIETLKNVINEETQKISTLQSEITSVKAKGSLAAEEQASKANARAAELEKQIEKLKKDIKDQNNKKISLEARASDAEKKVQELNAKLEKLQRTSDEQKRRIQKTELALKAAEEELLKVQMETTTKLKQLREVGVILIALFLAGSWSMVATLDVMSDHWNEHGKPVFNSLLQKASEISVEAKKWAKPHVETAKMKWVPVAKEKWDILKKNSEPYVRMASTKSVEVYQVSKDFITPHLVNAREAADPYLQAQTTILDYLHQHEFTKEFATQEVVWYLASALLVMPVLVVYTLLVETFCTKKQKKSPRSSNANHGHRRHKRRHADK